MVLRRQLKEVRLAHLDREFDGGADLVGPKALRADDEFMATGGQIEIGLRAHRLHDLERRREDPIGVRNGGQAPLFHIFRADAEADLLVLPRRQLIGVFRGDFQ